MNENAAPHSTVAPVVETVLGVQFDKLAGFRSQHYGLFWLKYLEPLGWQTFTDETPLPTYQEKFDRARLVRDFNPPSSTLQVRMKLKNEARTQTVQIQADKLYFSWNRDQDGMASYKEVLPVFESLFESYQQFAVDNSLGQLTPNLWEITYINRVPPGSLWQSLADWHRIFPSLFSPKSSDCVGVSLASYDGTWYYEIEPKAGRISLQVAKMIVNLVPKAVLCFILTGRGEITNSGRWMDGLDLGHDSCIRLFRELTSLEAQEEWGLR